VGEHAGLVDVVGGQIRQGAATAVDATPRKLCSNDLMTLWVRLRNCISACRWCRKFARVCSSCADGADDVVLLAQAIPRRRESAAGVAELVPAARQRVHAEIPRFVGLCAADRSPTLDKCPQRRRSG
jgi:hypothetical protein